MKSLRHFKRRLNTVKKLKNFEVIPLVCVQTTKIMADPFTKGLSRNMVDLALREMGLRPT
jgi:hypothetical protein